MKLLTWLFALGGIALTIFLIVHTGIDDIIDSLALIGWNLLWIPLLHIPSVVLDALGWRVLVARKDEHHRAGAVFLTWVALVREGVARLLPVASIGGELVGIRLVVLNGLNGATTTASIIIEVLLTIVSQYLFTAIGVLCLIGLLQPSELTTQLLWALGLTFPIPIVLLVLLRNTRIFQRLEGVAERILGGRGKLAAMISGSGASLDSEIRFLIAQHRDLAVTIFWQFAGMALGSLEVWVVLWLLGHPVSPTAAFALESIVLAVRHLAFLIPAGLGVQEAGLIVFGQMLGLDSETALALSLVKRMRELILGLPALLSWQYYEARHLKRKRAADTSR